MTIDLKKTAATTQEWATHHSFATMSIIAALGVVFRILATLRFESLGSVAHSDIPNVAYAMLHHRGYADAYGPGSGPTAHYGPIHTLILTAIYAVFGFGHAGVLAQHALGLVMVAAVTMLLLPMATACGLPPISAFIGGLIFAFPASLTAEDGQWEAPLTAGLSCLTAIGTVTLLRQGVWSLRDVVVGGLVSGIALLNSPASLPWFVTLAALALLSLRPRHFVLIAGSVACLVLLPWTIRNERAIGAPVWSRSDLGLELSLAHNDQTCVQLWDCYDSGLFDRLHPSCSVLERARVMKTGEAAYNREKCEQALRWALGHLKTEARLFGARVFRFWFPTLKRSRLQAIVVWGTAIFGLLTLAEYSGVTRTRKPASRRR